MYAHPRWNLKMFCSQMHSKCVDRMMLLDKHFLKTRRLRQWPWRFVNKSTKQCSITMLERRYSFVYTVNWHFASSFRHYNHLTVPSDLSSSHFRAEHRRPISCVHHGGKAGFWRKYHQFFFAKQMFSSKVFFNKTFKTNKVWCYSFPQQKSELLTLLPSQQLKASAPNTHI